jgi:hypothetical protein
MPRDEPLRDPFGAGLCGKEYVSVTLVPLSSWPPPVIGGITGIISATMWELVADIFRDIALLLSACAAWAARALADIRLILFGMLGLLLSFYVLTRPQADDH